MKTLTLDKFPKKVLRQIDIQKAFIVSRLITAAERLQLFRFLGRKRLTADAIGRKLKLHSFYLRPFLDLLVSLGLLRKDGGKYWNSPFAEKYFVAGRPIEWTRQFSAECAEDYDALTVVERALASGKTCQAILKTPRLSYIESMQRDRRRAEDFTQMLFHLHTKDADALAAYLDLSGHQAVLDVGGGSGVMSIALAKRHSHLRACILDIAPVCEVAARNVRRARLSRRVSTLAGDIRKPLPAGYDVVLICDIGAVSPRLLRNAYCGLPSKGLLVLADRYLTDDGTRPLDRLAEHFVGSSFGLATRPGMLKAVRSCGFRRVKAKNVYRDVWYITAIKP
jgi:3-hydroxy-5-methyl-1-naphthoate 3-O-methyltransferase